MPGELEKQFARDTVKGAAIVELQRRTPIKKVVDGAGLDTDIAVPGIEETDTLTSVIMFAAGVPSEIDLAEVTITEDDVIQLSTTDSTGNKLVVEFFKKSFAEST